MTVTVYRCGSAVQVGDVAIDHDDGTILSRRDGYWVDGGFQLHVDNYYGDDGETVPLLRVEDAHVDGPLDLLYRPSTVPDHLPDNDESRGHGSVR